MAYVGASAVEINTWVWIGDNTKICYEVLPDADEVEFTIGGRAGLELHMSEAALRNCAEAFTGALGKFDASKQRTQL